MTTNKIWKWPNAHSDLILKSFPSLLNSCWPHFDSYLTLFILFWVPFPVSFPRWLDTQYKNSSICKRDMILHGYTDKSIIHLYHLINRITFNPSKSKVWSLCLVLILFIDLDFSLSVEAKYKLLRFRFFHLCLISRIWPFEGSFFGFGSSAGNSIDDLILFPHVGMLPLLPWDEVWIGASRSKLMGLIGFDTKFFLITWVGRIEFSPRLEILKLSVKRIILISDWIIRIFSRWDF